MASQAPKGDVDLTEREFAAIVADLARQLGWLRYHTFRSERSQPGFPDEVLVRERVLFVELKTERGRLSAAQEQWLGRLNAAGAEVYVWRPSDLDDIACVLSRGMSPAADREPAARNGRETEGGTR